MKKKTIHLTFLNSDLNTTFKIKNTKELEIELKSFQYILNYLQIISLKTNTDITKSRKQFDSYEIEDDETFFVLFGEKKNNR